MSSSRPWTTCTSMENNTKRVKKTSVHSVLDCGCLVDSRALRGYILLEHLLYLLLELTTLLLGDKVLNSLICSSMISNREKLVVVPDNPLWLDQELLLITFLSKCSSV